MMTYHAGVVLGRNVDSGAGQRVSSGFPRDVRNYHPVSHRMFVHAGGVLELKGDHHYCGDSLVEP